MTVAVYQPKPGDRVRVTRHAHGKVKFVKTGVIIETGLPYGYRFKDDDGRSVFLASPEQVAAMPGWSQTIELLFT
jgi:hypothetical protein